MGSLYSISSLQCSYNQGRHVVLEIDSLEIPPGKVVFIIGASGIGKSTVLEALGMMTYTLHNPREAKLVFQDPLNNGVTDLADLWRKGDRALSKFRNRHFSFIFQNTNLMSNLDAIENVLITQLIQGKSFSSSRKRTIEIMELIGLSDIKEGQLINTLSGGQRQRLAFCRAIAPDFTVLFGDEPTGNLDMNNAHNLMDVLKKILHEKGSSAIIVSHDIELAVKYSDMIIFIRKECRESGNMNGFKEVETSGRISIDGIYTKLNATRWLNREIHLSSESLKQKLVGELHLTSNLDI
jgi:ABC-type lipoprotein export system ATPase subunit